MKKQLITTITLVFGCVFLLSSPTWAGELEELQKRIKQLEEKTDKLGESKELLGRLSDNIQLRGAIELDFSHTDPKDISNPKSASKSEFDIGTVELGAEMKFHEWVTGNVLLKGENLSSGNDRIFWDEATIAIQKDGFPVYLVAGKRAQPFGVFNSHLINDPITQDCYEVAKTGATVGFLPGLLGLDISATLYKGEIIPDKLSEAGFGWARDPNPNPDPTDQVNSYILNVSMEPMKDLKVIAYLDSEPGQQDRNTTAGASIGYTIANFSFDAEYIKALSREIHATNVKKHKESAWFGAIAYRVIDPLEIAVRYESFDDDIPGDQDGHLTNRYSIGANYTLFAKDTFSTTLMVEYRRSNYEKAAGSAIHDKADELFARLAFAF
jgi:hypothetical protein